MTWIFLYEVADSKVLYGDTVLADSFSDAVSVARSICRAARYTLLGVMPLEVVSAHRSCFFKVHKF